MASVEKFKNELVDLEKKVAAKVNSVEATLIGDVKKIEEAVVGFFKTVFGHPLHDPTQGVTVSPTDATGAVKTVWIQGQIAAGTVVEVDSQGAAVTPAPAAPAGDPAVAPVTPAPATTAGDPGLAPAADPATPASGVKTEVTP